MVPRNTVCTSPASAVFFGWASDGGGQLGVGLALAHLGEVDGDEVVGVGLGLRAGGQRLPGVGAHGGLVGGGQGLEPGVGCGGEDDFLGGELVVHLAVGERVAPHQQPARDEQHRGQDEPARADQ